MSLGASREESHDCSVNRHGLVGLILNCEGMSHSNPCEKETFIENDSFLEVFSCYFVFFAVKVVGANSEPADWMR